MSESSSSENNDQLHQSAIELAGRSFLHKHHDWFHTRLQEGELVYRFPSRALPQLALMFSLSDSDLAAEEEFDSVCLGIRAIGLSVSGPLACDYLLPPFTARDADLLRRMGAFGWTSKEMDLAITVFHRSQNSLMPRMKAIAGRRISDPCFLHNRDEIRSIWKQLPPDERPALPLRKIAHPERSTMPDGKPASAELQAFFTQLDAFLRKWRLREMITWQIPLPEGFQWPDLRTSKSEEGMVVFHTPPDFSLQETDKLGSIVSVEHQRSARAKNLTDLKRWDTYARLLEIDHWQRVIHERYTACDRPRAFLTKLDDVLGAILFIDPERVKKLRWELRMLQAGKRSTLSSAR